MQLASYDDSQQEHRPEAGPCDWIGEAQRRPAVAEVAKNVRVDSSAWGFPPGLKARSLQDKAFLAGLKTRFPGLEVRGWHRLARIGQDQAVACYKIWRFGSMLASLALTSRKGPFGVIGKGRDHRAFEYQTYDNSGGSAGRTDLRREHGKRHLHRPLQPVDGGFSAGARLPSCHRKCASLPDGSSVFETELTGESLLFRAFDGICRPQHLHQSSR